MFAKNEKREAFPFYFLTFLVVFVTAFIFTQVYAASTISTNVDTGGDLILSSAGSQIEFANGWKFSQTTGSSDEVTITDSANVDVLIFDEE